MCFDKTRVVGEVSKHLICPICSNIFCIDCKQNSNGDTFCTACFDLLDFNDSKTDNLMPASNEFKNILRELKVYCKYRMGGCNKSVELKDIDSHESTCQYKSMKCSKGCGQTIISNEFQSHDCLKYLLGLVSKLEKQNEELRYRLDEIERTKSEVSVIEKSSILSNKEVEDLKSENDRLRKELEKALHQTDKNQSLEEILEKKLKSSDYKSISLNEIQPQCILSLTNEYLVVIDTTSIHFLNKELEIVKKSSIFPLENGNDSIEKVFGWSYNSESLFILAFYKDSDSSSIGFNKKKLLKSTDEIDKFVGVQLPYDVARALEKATDLFYNNHLLYSSNYDQRIHIFSCTDSSLKLQNSIIIQFHPENIAANENYMLVKSRKKLYFYQDSKLLRSNVDDSTLVGVFDSKLYKYTNGIIYFYLNDDDFEKCNAVMLEKNCKNQVASLCGITLFGNKILVHYRDKEANKNHLLVFDLN